LLNSQADASAQTFLARLIQSQTIEQKRQLIVDFLVPALRYEGAIKLREGREIPTRTVLRDILQEFLHEDGVTENVPTNEAETPEEADERERLARPFSEGKSAAEMAIEDRGPR
jgi:hypothetical protein